MLNILILLLTMFSSLFATQANEALTGVSPDILRISHDFLHHKYIVEDQVNAAVHQMNVWIDDNPDVSPENMAVVFDIDETLLDTYSFMEASNFSYSLDELDEWMATASAEPIESVQALCGQLLDAGVNVYILTGRHEAIRKETEQNLRKFTCSRWNKLYMRPSNNGSDQIKNYKLAAFEEIQKSGNVILLAIGDQYPDVMNLNAKVRVKLPNPYYNIMNKPAKLKFSS